MTIVVPNEGEVNALEAFLTDENQTLRLFANNITPAETDTTGTYTEAAGGGYAAKTLTGTLSGSTWTVTAGAPSSGAYPEQTWTFTGALTTNPTVYGYYLEGATSGDLLWAERAASSFTPANNGDTIDLTPTITAD